MCKLLSTQRECEDMALKSTSANGRFQDTAVMAEQHSPAPSSHDHEEIGDLLYDKIFPIEPYLAPFITGMILEMDHYIVAEIVGCGNERQLLDAVEKAKKSFLDAHGVDVSKRLSPLSSSSSHVILSKSPSLVKSKNVTEDAGQSLEEKKGEEFGLIVFERAECLHGEYAPEITGMILEMDFLSLKQIVADSGLLDEAISKAHAALSTQSQCIAF